MSKKKEKKEFVPERIRIKVWGDKACFGMPFTTEKRSYPAITPSACKGILDSIFWNPSMKWVIDSITVLNEIQYESYAFNGVGDVVDPKAIVRAMEKEALGIDPEFYLDPRKKKVQRRYQQLVKVAYVIEAHMELVIDTEDPNHEMGKNYGIFHRRAKKGLSYHLPCLGRKELFARYELLGRDEDTPKGYYSDVEHMELYRMPYAMDYSSSNGFITFDAVMKYGVIEIPEETKERFIHVSKAASGLL